MLIVNFLLTFSSFDWSMYYQANKLFSHQLGLNINFRSLNFMIDLFMPSLIYHHHLNGFWEARGHWGTRIIVSTFKQMGLLGVTACCVRHQNNMYTTGRCHWGVHFVGFEGLVIIWQSEGLITSWYLWAVDRYSNLGPDIISAWLHEWGLWSFLLKP